MTSIRLKFLGLVIATGLSTLSCVTPRNARDSAAAMVDEATQAKQASKWLAASELYDRALTLDPTNLAALRGLVETHQLLGRLPLLETRFQQAIALSPGDPYAHHGLGLTYFARGGAYGDRAIAALQKAADLGPDEPDFNYRLGLALVESDRYADAVKALEKAVQKGPTLPRIRLPYAVALMKTGRRRDAVEQLAKVLELAPTPEEVQLAERTAKKLLDPFQGFPMAAREQFESALQWLDSESTTQAQQALQQLLERFPDLAIVHAMYGLASIRKDEAGRAIAAYRKAIELAPQLAEPHLFLADLYLARGRPDTAIEHYRDALARNPFLADGHKRYGQALEKVGDMGPALDRYAVYLLLRPEDYEVAFARAGLLSDKDPAAADVAWDALLKAFPRRPDGLIAAGRHFMVRSTQMPTTEEKHVAKEKSRKALDAALEIDPENETAAAIRAELGKLPW